MSVLVEGIKTLIRRCDDLPNNMSRTEVTHYAMELARQLKSGANVEQLDLYLSGILINNSPIPHVRLELAERAFNLFSSFKAGRITM
jgi:hypothetical protein